MLKLIIGALLSMALAAGAAGPALANQPGEQQIPFLLDADTANEMDDLYAITHAVLDPRAKVLAVSSAHFNNAEIYSSGKWHKYEMFGFSPVAASQRENERLLGLLGEDVPTPLGAAHMLGHAWGFYEGAPVPDAPAIDWIIERARAASPDAKLKVLTLGPLTNVAAAIVKAPDIAPRIHVYWLGAKYDAKRRVWDKSEFNARNDLNAVDLLFNRADVAFTVMPASVAQTLTFDREDSRRRLQAMSHPAAPMLWDRWDFVSAGDSWIMWDLALTMAVTHPEWATLAVRRAPPENARDRVEVFTAIDATAMRKHFWSLLESAGQPR